MSSFEKKFRAGFCMTLDTGCRINLGSSDLHPAASVQNLFVFFIGTRGGKVTARKHDFG